MEISSDEVKISPEDLQNMSPEELKDFQKKNCIFCHIISGKVQSKKIYEDERSLAVLDINPANPGHMLLLPKEHYTIMPQIPETDIGHLFMVVKGLSKACLKALKAEGTTIFVANGVAAGQKSPHFMIHIIPRKETDDLTNFKFKRKKIKEADLEKLHKALREKLMKEEKVEKKKEEKVVEAEFKEEIKEKEEVKEEIKKTQETQRVSGPQKSKRFFREKEKEETKEKKKEVKEKKPKKETKKKKEEKTKTKKKEESYEADLADIASVLFGK